MKTTETNNHPKTQDQWSSKWAFILAATGAAVGLGNIWRFPYMAGSHGGSAFVFVYLICIVLIGLPILIAEILIGRRARQNPVDALSTLAQQAKHTRKWGYIGWLGALALLLVLSFYSVVAGWSIAYLLKSLTGQFHHLNATQITQLWQHFLSNPLRLLGWHTLFMLLTMGVIARGVQQGLEKATRFMMPALYLVLFILVFYAIKIGNVRQAVHFLFDFNLHKITGTVIIAAMGHAFFSLALGAGAMLTYGAYVPKNVNITSTVFIVAGLDVLVAILSGLAIFPIVFAFHLSPQAGPGLMYEILPVAFASIPGGAIIGSLFFLLLLFAAWTSSINLAEPLVLILMQRHSLKRGTACCFVGLAAWFVGIGSLLSFNVWKNVHFAHHLTVFDIATNLPTDILLPLGGLGFALFAGWVLSKAATREEINTTAFAYKLWRFLIRYIAPAGILVIFLAAFF